MHQDNRTLQLISIQHELSMNIGLDLDLEKMLSVFMQRAQQRLSLSAVMVTHNISMPNVKNCIAFPREFETKNSWLIDKASLWYHKENGGYSQSKQNGFFYYLFVIPEFGVLILERKHLPIDPMILDAFHPLLDKLSTSCLACVEHQNLIEEITARKKAEHSLVKQSLLDPLTGLPNRKMLELSLHQAINRATYTGQFGAVFFIDLDRFKIINDSLGHSAGDEVLKKVAHRLAECITDDATFARMGGDEFVLVVTNLSTDNVRAMAKAKTIAEQLSTQLNPSIYVQENHLSISISTGISLFPLENSHDLSKEKQANLLLRNADLAMYRIKHTNRNGYCFFTSDLQSHSEKRTQVEKHLRTAIDRNELEICCQPLVNQGGQVLGAEALLRWKNQYLGQVSPVDFIPIAEESGLIIELGRWVLEQVCRLMRKINEGGINPEFNYISVNVSPLQFNQIGFVQDFIDVLQAYKIDSQQVRIEITENVAVDDIELTISKINQLKEFGIHCMLDDFGSGYSSLSYLNRLPLKAIKIDRSFVSNIDQSKYHQLIVKAVSDISNFSELECIAEGVETQAEFEYLHSQQVGIFQGYYFHKPMPVDKFILLVAASTI